MQKQKNSEKAAPHKCTFIGIDPGKFGAVAVISDDIAITSFNIDNLQPFINTLKQATKNEYKLYIEYAHSKPGDGHKGAFTFGKNYGIILGIFATLNITPTNIVDSKKWKRYFNLIGKTKQDSIIKTKELYSNITLRRTPRCTTDDNNMAEALLIAHYCKQMESEHD